MKNFSYVHNLQPSTLTGILKDIFHEDIEGLVLMNLSHQFRYYGRHEITAKLSSVDNPEVEINLHQYTEDMRLIDDWGSEESFEKALTLVLENECNREVVNTSLLNL